MDIEKYGIIRRKWTPEIGLLIGNGEMGGLIRNDGLGFDELWLTDFWRNEAERAPVGPFRLSYTDVLEVPVVYTQRLSLREAVVVTEVQCVSGQGYRTRCFFSQRHRHLLVFQLENFSKHTQKWTLLLPEQPEAVDACTINVTCGAKAPPMELPFTSLAWSIRSSQPWEVSEAGVGFSLRPGESVTISSGLVTSFDTPSFQCLAHDIVASAKAYEILEADHKRDWAALWERVDIDLPQGQYAETFYRSLYYTFAITGASRFLPGVCQFADPGWEMIPFTNDAGYVVALLAAVNHPERATALLREFHKPAALRKNGQTYLNILEAVGTQDDPGEVYSFAQMINISGTESNFVYGRQRHLDGFMPAIYHRVASLTAGNPECGEMTYDVLKGCAIFWLRMLFQGDEGLMIRKTLDLDEKTHDVSVMSAVIACGWALKMFARYARERGSDLELAQRCEKSAELLYWPQNEERYLSFPDDPEDDITSKYNCIRCFSTLSYPFCELIESYDRPKALRTMDAARSRNQLEKVDSGVNAMTTNMYALAEACFGRSEEALQYASLALKRLDPSGVAMGEARTDSLFYCSTSYSTFALTTVQMLLQTYDEVIYPFPAVPDCWQDISFSRLPAEHGIFVSAELCGGAVKRVLYEKDGKVLLETDDALPVRIIVRDGNVTLLKENAGKRTNELMPI